MINVQPQPESIKRVFAMHSLRFTRQRSAIYTALCSDKSHPTADKLFRDVSPRIEGLSLATVYNTLEAFCRCGLAQKLPGDTRATGNASARYDGTVDNHLHLRCIDTGAVHDVPDDLGDRFLSSVPADVINEIESKLGFKIKQLQIELVGQFA